MASKTENISSASLSRTRRLFQELRRDELCDYGICAQLISDGIELEERNSQFSGATPLMMAAMFNNTALTEALIKEGANVEATNDEGMTALSLAASCDATAVLSVLTMHGADVNTTDNAGNTPLMHAAREAYDVTAYALIKLGADTSLKNKNDKTASDLAKKFMHPDKAIPFGKTCTTVQFQRAADAGTRQSRTIRRPKTSTTSPTHK